MEKSFIDYVMDFSILPAIIFKKSNKKIIRVIGVVLLYPWFFIMAIPLLIAITIGLTIEVFKET